MSRGDELVDCRSPQRRRDEEALEVIASGPEGHGQLGLASVFLADTANSS